jgi:CHAT domain-containing protein
MKRFWSALLLVAAAASCCREQPEALYKQGREALQRGEMKDAERIAQKGERCFAAQPYWRELFAILEAESVVRTDSARAQDILARLPALSAPLPRVRQLMTCALFEPNPADADELYECADALAAQAASQLRPEIAMRRIPLATCDEDVVRFAQQAIDGATALKQTWIVAGAYGIVGRFSASRERWDDAIDNFIHALHYGNAARLARLETASMVNLGWAYLQIGDYEQARPHLLNALTLARQQSDDYHEHLALILIADIYERRNELVNALLYARQALAAADQPTELANAYHQLAYIELELDHYDIAKPLNEEAREWRKAAGKDELYERSIDARLLAENGDPAGAINLLEDLLASHELNASDRCRAQGIEAGVYFRLGQFDNAERMFKQTLETAEKVRSQFKGMTSLAFERNLLAFYDGYIDLLLKQDRRADALLVAESSRARVLKEKKINYSSDAVDPRALARRKNATILCYWLGEKRSLVWSVTANDIHVATLPGADAIDRAAADYQRELQLPREKPLQSDLGAPLYRMLVAPANVATRRVIILPVSSLNALNFEALIVPAPKPHFWIEDVTISYSPSLGLLAGAPEWKPHEARLLVMGAVPAAGPDFPLLKRAGDEIDGIVQSFDPSQCVVVRGPAATPAAYLGLHPETFEFIHFAAHGTADTAAPFDSSVILAGGALRGYDIIRNNHRLHAELVTVSSCNSAGGRSYAGEGMVGLAWAFLGAGAHRVVAAQWNVIDAAAPELMKTMYSEIARGAEPAEALHTAKLALLQSKEELNHRPAFWAPFVIYEAM